MDYQVNQSQSLTKNREQREAEITKTGSKFDELFSRKWEVFVVKLNEKTGKFIGKVACCALQPV